jgi:alpha-beta hydrolase superfamily lysophospholipase
MSLRLEGHFKGHDQLELFYQTWTPDKVRGLFVITHGLAEHSDCYNPLASRLADDGWKVFAWDLRGHGRSEGKRGFVRHISDYVDDLDVFYKLVSRERKGLNLVLFGHSMGGMVTLRFAESRPVDASALVLSSPALGLTLQVPKLKEQVARLAIKWWPTLTLHNEIKYEDLSRPEEMQKLYRTDTLRHEKVSPGLFLSMLETFPLAKADAAQVQMPVLMQLSGEDRLVSSEASRQVFEHFPNKKNQLILYPESLHEIYNCVERDVVIGDLKKFISPYLGA